MKTVVEQRDYDDLLEIVRRLVANYGRLYVGNERLICASCGGTWSISDRVTRQSHYNGCVLGDAQALLKRLEGTR